jgi:Arc/MetJ family transcription regulator
MRTTLNIDDELLARARAITGIDGKTALVNAGLRALISRAASLRLAELGGTQPALEGPSRR